VFDNVGLSCIIGAAYEVDPAVHGRWRSAPRCAHNAVRMPRASRNQSTRSDSATRRSAWNWTCTRPSYRTYNARPWSGSRRCSKHDRRRIGAACKDLQEVNLKSTSRLLLARNGLATSQKSSRDPCVPTHSGGGRYWDRTRDLSWVCLS